MFEFDLHSLISTFSYLGIFILLVINGAVNFPSSQIVYLIVGYFIAIGKLSFLPAIIFGSLGNTIGNLIIYFLVYKYGKVIVTKYLYIKEDILNKMHKEFEGRGLWFLYVGKLTPSIKVFIPAIAGLSKITRTHAVFLFSITSIIWSSVILYIGFKFGEQITFQNYSIVMGIVGIIVALIAYKQMKKIN